MYFFIYYLLVYIVIFIIRILKVVMQEFKTIAPNIPSEIPSDKPARKLYLWDKWSRVTFIGLDIVYGASGLVVVLFAKMTGEQMGLGIVLFVYLALLFIAVIADIIFDKFGTKKAAYLNIFLVAAVIGATYWVSFNMLSKPVTHYKIFIPYKDSSILPWGFHKYKKINFVHYVNVTENNEKKALEKAKDDFWKTISPVVEMKVTKRRNQNIPQKHEEVTLTEDAYKRSKIEIDEANILIAKIEKN